MPTNTIPQTQNREWGFFGTMAHHADPERAWDIALGFDLELTIRFGIFSDRGFRLGGSVATICG